MTSKIIGPVAITVSVAAVTATILLVKKAFYAKPVETDNWLPRNSYNEYHFKDTVPPVEPSEKGEDASESDAPAKTEQTPAEAKQEAVTESLEVLGISENNVPDAVKLGTGEDEVKPLGKEYKKIVRAAQKKAEKNPDYRLRVTGKTYGLGARGKTIVINDTTIIEYDAKDIKKLVAKIEG